MKRLALLATMLVSVNALSAPPPDGLQAFYSGNKFLQAPPLAQTAYLEGQLDMLYAVDSNLDSALYARLLRCTHNWTAGQATAIMKKFLNAHPESWDISAAELFNVAVTQACKDSGKPLH